MARASLWYAPGMPSPTLSPALFTFFRNLNKNNTSEWFQSHKAEYERDVKGPLLAFVTGLQPKMAKISPRIKVVPKAVGGSLQRLNRDTRFSKDKSPYKTNAGLMFGVEGAGELMLGYHLTLAPGDDGVKAYVGLWEPDSATINAVRAKIVASAGGWKKAVPAAFRTAYTFEGESLKRPPKVNDEPVAEDHPFIEDLKRKSFAACTTFTEKQAVAPDFVDRYVESAKAGEPLMRFLCEATGVKF
jgi:uncharacterized protein (TIGR02453 family)